MIVSENMRNGILFELVTTVLNEKKRLAQTISDIESQTRKPHRIIIIDAGSKDGTFEQLMKWKNSSVLSIEVIQLPGCNVAQGRNHAICLTQTDLIASTDFGCRYHPDWLASIIEPFEEDLSLEVVGGSFTVREEDIINLAQKADFVLQNGYHVKMDDGFSVSSRSIAYRKKVWEKIGGYPEWLTLAADDTIFWRQIKKRGFRYQLIDKPYVYWMRHQTFKGFGKEAGRYGLGDGESGINFRTYISHLIETFMRYSLVVHLLVLPFYIPHTQLPLFIFAFQIVGLRSYGNAIKKWWKWRSSKFNMAVLIACFWMIEVSRMRYMWGYTKGWINRDIKQKEASKKLRSEIS